MLWLLGIIVWVIVAFWPATVAKRKGYSFILFFLLSILCFFVSIIVAYAIKDKNMTKADKEADEAAERILDEQENAA